MAQDGLTDTRQPTVRSLSAQSIASAIEPTVPDVKEKVDSEHIDHNYNDKDIVCLVNQIDPDVGTEGGMSGEEDYEDHLDEDTTAAKAALDIDHNDTTVRWLNENDLSCIIQKCLQNDITLDVLIEAELDDIKTMCKDAAIKTQYRLKLQSALKKTGHSHLEKKEASIKEELSLYRTNTKSNAVPPPKAPVRMSTSPPPKPRSTSPPPPVRKSTSPPPKPRSRSHAIPTIPSPLIPIQKSMEDLNDTQANVDLSTKQHDSRFQLLLIGDSEVGKTAIMQRFREDTFNPAISTTIGVDFASKNVQIGDKIIKLQVWDSAGQEKYRSVTALCYRGKDAVCIVYNITKKKSFEHVTSWLSEVRYRASDDVVVYVIGTKNDLEEKRVVSYEEGQQLCKAENCEFYEVSAKTGRNIPQLFNAIAVHLLDIEQQKEDKKEEIHNIILSASNEHTKKKKKKCCNK
eukprot:365157_1